MVEAVPEDVANAINAELSKRLAQKRELRVQRDRHGTDTLLKAGRCEGASLDLRPFTSETAFDLDFNGASKGERRIRGAYAIPNAAGWRLQSGWKP
jgi:hypothetical protein